MQDHRPSPLLCCLLLLASCGGGGEGGENDTNLNNQPATRCGDGLVEGVEECDDGAANSDTAPNACRTDCRPARCGDLVVDDGELCDDGAANSDSVPDACRSDCTTSRCGDGVVDVGSGETCDPGPDVPGDDCGPGCQVMYCGNGVVEDGEVCDDGNVTAGDGCSPDCQSDETCGNGIPDFAAGETCDCGTDPNALPSGCDAPNGAPDGRCTAACQAVFCGNGVVDPNEVCDDGNLLAGDGCSPNCLSDETCGNGWPDFAAGETCDCGTDPNALPLGCGAVNGALGGTCTDTCETRFCGDGVQSAGEVCDDGNTNAGDGCSPDCLSDETCGNGTTDFVTGETCDCGTDPAALPTGCAAVNGATLSHCSAGCEIRYCGNGVVDPTEVCDDGNTVSGDGCSADCRSTEICGNGVVDVVAGEVCDDGNTVAGDGCGAACQLEICGNGLLEAGEVCDDGNTIGGDGCRADCQSDETCGNGELDVAAGEVCDCGVGGGGPSCTPYGSDGTYSSCTVAHAFVDISTTGALALAADESNTAVPIGFTFTFYGQTHTTAYLQSNGGITFASGTLTYNNAALPAGAAEALIAPYWDDLDSSAGGLQGVYYQTSGAAGARRFVAQWVTERWSGDVVAVFQVVLFEATDSIEFHYQSTALGDASYDHGASATVGIQASSGGPGLQYSFDQAQLSDGLSLWFGLAIGEPLPPGCTAGNGDPGGNCSATCQPYVCGNGVLDPGEVCDDGNYVSGDGCSADCRSDETCGNGVVDLAAGESCDEGTANSDAPNATCRSDCQSQRCGDAQVDDLLGEDCEAGQIGTRTCDYYGFYSGSVTCDANCHYDSGGCYDECGDGVINGPEPCDVDVPSGESCLTYGFDLGRLSCHPICMLDFGSCRSMGWHLDHQLGDFQKILGFAPTDVYAMSSGNVMRYDGVGWQDLPGVGSGASLNDLWGSSGSDLYVVNIAGEILHFDGVSWSAMSVPTTVNLEGIWGAAADDVFAVGEAGTILRYDGSSWNVMTTSTVANFTAVWGTSASDVFATALSGAIMHFDGVSWSFMSKPPSDALYDIWGLDSNHVWAVGWGGSLLSYDGTTWTTLNSGTTDILYGVTANAPDDVWVAGAGGTLLHFNGASWRPIVVPTSETLRSAWALGDGRIVVGGSLGALLHYSGQSWLPVPTELSGATGDLKAVWAASATSAFAVMVNEVLRYDGDTWSNADSPTLPDVGNGIWGSADDDVFLVGDNGMIQHYDGTAWAAMTSPTAVHLHAVWGSSGGDVFAVGDGGTIAHYNGTSWTTQGSSTTQTLRAVFGFSPTEVWAVGNASTLLRYDGLVWAPVATGVVTDHLAAVWGSSPADLFLAASGGRIFHFDGTSWAEMDSPTDSNLLTIWGAAADDVFAAGTLGTLLHYDGAVWEPVRSASTQGLLSLHGVPGRAVFVAGQNRTLKELHYVVAF